MRGVPGLYPEYHSSLDNKKKISMKVLIEMIDIYVEICKFFESFKYKKIKKNKIFNPNKKKLLKKKQIFLNLNPYCEPNLSKRNLQKTIG